MSQPGGGAGVANAVRRITAELTPNLLYWNERRCWMWHKKWCLPRIHVRVERTDGLPLSAPGEGGSGGAEELVVLVSAGTMREGPSLHDQGLGGECQRRLVDGTATFSSLLFQHTSFNCGNRPFHLVLTLLRGAPVVTAEPADGGRGSRGDGLAAAAGARAMVALATALSNPIHVDARKRTKVERPDAAEDDVRLAQRSRNAPARAPAPARALQPAAAAANTAGGGLGQWAVLFDATGDALLELLPDLTVCRSFTTTSYGYPALASAESRSFASSTPRSARHCSRRRRRSSRWLSATRLRRPGGRRARPLRRSRAAPSALLRRRAGRRPPGDLGRFSRHCTLAFGVGLRPAPHPLVAMRAPAGGRRRRVVRQPGSSAQQHFRT